MISPQSNNPSLNDILKPLLEEKGWKYNSAWSLKVTPQSNNPSLLDLIKPLLEAKGWVSEGSTLRHNHFYFKGSSAINVLDNSVLNCRGEESLSPSQPDFFERLAEWLN